MKLNRRYLSKNISKEDTIYKAQHSPHTWLTPSHLTYWWKKGDTHTNKDTCNKDTKRKNKHKGTTYWQCAGDESFESH